MSNNSIKPSWGHNDMSKKSTRSNQIGQTKRSTDNMIDDAIAQQNSWMERRRAFANKFLRRLNVFAKPAPEKKVVGRPAVRADAAHPVVSEPRHGILRAYWFPIVCAIVVIFIAPLGSLKSPALRGRRVRAVHCPSPSA